MGIMSGCDVNMFLKALIGGLVDDEMMNGISVYSIEVFFVFALLKEYFIVLRSFMIRF